MLKEDRSFPDLVRDVALQSQFFVRSAPAISAKVVTNSAHAAPGVTKLHSIASFGDARNLVGYAIPRPDPSLSAVLAITDHITKMLRNRSIAIAAISPVGKIVRHPHRRTARSHMPARPADVTSTG